MNAEVPSVKDVQAFGNYTFDKEIGSGAFCRVFVGENTLSGQQVAIKIEDANTAKSQFQRERWAYSFLNGVYGVPRIHTVETNGIHNFLVMDLLGPSLEDLFNMCRRKFTLKTVIMVALEVLRRLERVHSHWLIHRDVKPENLLVGIGQSRRTIFLVDFGYRTAKFSHIAYRDNVPFRGTMRYASISALSCMQQSRRDDLESVAYMLIYFMKGSLPWQNVKCSTVEETADKIAAMKRSIPIASLCEGLPKVFSYLLSYSRGLSFNEAPNYVFLSQLLRSTLCEHNLELDHSFDWSESLTALRARLPGGVDRL